MDEFIPTRASMAKKNSATDIQVVSYESHKPKAKTEKQSREVYKPNEFSNDVGFDIKEAKHEVIKFGMSGFTGKRKEQAKMQLAIKLGAKPPKNKYKNYKELLEEKKKQKLREENRKNSFQLGKNGVGKSTAKGKTFDKKRKKDKGDLLNIYGKVTKGMKK